MANNSLSKEIKKNLEEYAKTRTSFYGITHIFKSTNLIATIFWSLAIIICIGGLSYQSIALITNYFIYEVVTKTEYHPEVVSRFPGVTICNQNPFTTEYSNKILSEIFNKSEIKENFLDENTQIKWEKLSEIKNLIQMFASNLTDDKKKMLGYSINETVLQCTFNMNSCDLNEFILYHDHEYGNCIVFNSLTEKIGTDHSQFKNVSISGNSNGLHMELFVGYNQTKYNSIFDKGAHVFIFNQSDEKNSYSEIDVSVGSKINIGIERLFTHKKELPYSECQTLENTKEKSKYQKILRDYAFKYHKSYCSNLCFQEFVFENCSCYDPKFFNLKETRPCNNSDRYCLSSALKTFYGSSVEINKCAEKCPIECNSIKYHLTLNQLDYPSKGLANLIKLDPRIQERFNNSSNISLEDLKQSLISINIYYNEIGFTTLLEMPKTDLITLVSNLGGNLGLFLGLSCLSLLEIFEICFITLKLIHKKFNKKKLKPDLTSSGLNLNKVGRNTHIYS